MLLAFFINNRKHLIVTNKLPKVILMIYYLIANTTYLYLELGLYKDDTCLSSLKILNNEINQLLLSSIEQLFQANNIKVADLEFISATQGPAPFTSLRATLATINGVAFATQKPLIGIFGIETMLKNYSDPKVITVAIFNAFNKEVYFGISDSESIRAIDSLPVIDFFKQLQSKSESLYPSKQIKFIGSAVSAYIEEIKSTFGKKAIIDLKIEEPSLEILSKAAKAKYENKSFSTQILPIYLKSSVGSKSKCLIL